MKAETKLKLKTFAAIITLLVSGATAFAQTIDPNTGLPATRSTAVIDPQTGLPVKIDPEADWKDPQWKDPSEVLTNLTWENLTFNEAVRQLRQKFGNDFDIIVSNPNPTPSAGNDPSFHPITLHLKNVTASEVFGAWNMKFEVENTPFRWRLAINGSRPTAVLRIKPELVRPAPKPERKVFFVGDLMGETGQIVSSAKIYGFVDAIADVWLYSGAAPEGLSGRDPTGGIYGTEIFPVLFKAPHERLMIYRPAQLLIVEGTPEQIDLTQQTLQALREKADLMQHKKQAKIVPNENSLKPAESKSGISDGKN